MNRSFFLCFAASRTRSSPWNTLSRLGVRRMRCPPVFPSALPLRSTDSASGRPVLFAGFFATLERSDFSCSFIFGYGSSPSRGGPPPVAERSNRRSPGSREKEHTYMPGSRTTQGRPGTCSGAPGRVAFRWVNGVGTLI